MSKNTEKVNRSWFFIILLTITSLGLAGTAAYFSIFGLAKLFHGAGLGIIILSSVLELSKLVTVSYVYRYWKYIAKALRVYYIFGIVFIMLLTSIGIYGFLTSAYQNTANKVEIRDSQIKIAENKKNLFVAQLDRLNKNIESNNNRIDALTTARNSQENRLNNLYTGNRVSSARRTENQISSSDKQIESLNADITTKMAQSNVINDSIAYYDQKIVELKSSDISSEVGPLKYLAELTNISMNKVVNILVLLIIFVFDPMAITLLIGVNQLLSMEKNNPTKNQMKMPFFKKRKDEEEESKQDEMLDEQEVKTPTSENKVASKEPSENKILKSVIPVITDELDITDDIEDTKDTEEDDKVLCGEINTVSKKNETTQQDCPDGYIQQRKDLNLDEIEIGLNVYHSSFGNGVIARFDKDKSRVFIKFETGTKELDPEYANLKKYECVEIQQENKRVFEPESVQYLDFSMDDPEYNDIISQLPKQEVKDVVEERIENGDSDSAIFNEISEPSIENIEVVEEQFEPVVEELVEEQSEPVVEKKTKLFHKIWRGKKIV